MRNSKRINTYQIHSLAFGLMMLSSVGLYFAARTGSEGWIWGLIGLFVLGNILALLVN